MQPVSGPRALFSPSSPQLHLCSVLLNTNVLCVTVRKLSQRPLNFWSASDLIALCNEAFQRGSVSHVDTEHRTCGQSNCAVLYMKAYPRLQRFLYNNVHYITNNFIIVHMLKSQYFGDTRPNKISIKTTVTSSAIYWGTRHSLCSVCVGCVHVRTHDTYLESSYMQIGLDMPMIVVKKHPFWYF